MLTASCLGSAKPTGVSEEEMGRQHQGTVWPGVHQVLVGSGELGTTEESGCEIICGAQTNLAVMGYMMMMKKNMMNMDPFKGLVKS